MSTVAEVKEEVPLTGNVDNMMQATVNQPVSNFSTDELQGRKQRLVSKLTTGNSGLQEVLLKYHYLSSVDEEKNPLSH